MSEQAASRSFVHAAEAWYGRSTLNGPDRIEDVIYISSEADAEFQIEWIGGLGGEPAARVCVFEDSWSVFREHAELFAWFGDHHGQAVAPGDVLSELGRLGYKDNTPRHPNPDRMSHAEIAGAVAASRGVPVTAVRLGVYDGQVHATIEGASS